jgi:hypothetical protein
MPLPNGQIGIIKNPIKESPFIQSWREGNDFPPPASEFRITDSNEHRITDSGDNRITD